MKAFKGCLLNWWIKPLSLEVEKGSISGRFKLFRSYQFCCVHYNFSFLAGEQFCLICEGLLWIITSAGFDSAAVSLLWGHQPHRLVWSLQRHPRARLLLPGIQRQLWSGQPGNVVDSGKFCHTGHTFFLCSGGPNRKLLGLALPKQNHWLSNIFASREEVAIPALSLSVMILSNLNKKLKHRNTQKRSKQFTWHDA